MTNRLTTRHASDAARIALRCLDFTSLNDGDTEASVAAFTERALTPHAPPAALCVYPRFVAAARRVLVAQGLDGVKIATVVNFPHGGSAAGEVAAEISAGLAAGADEIDAVFPWRALQAGDAAAGTAMLRACRRACGGATLKVILETGELASPALITRAAEIAVAEGADYLKTSTGKVPINATPEAVQRLLTVIAQHGGRVGLKIAGGLKTMDDVQLYLTLAAAACGEAWLAPERLRFGASSLLPVLLAVLDGRHNERGEPGTAGY